MQDFVSDALIRIKNGYMASKPQVSLEHSNSVMRICKLLKQENFIEDATKKDRQILVILKYNQHAPALSGVKRVSKPSARIYKKATALSKYFSNLGIRIISTPKVIMSDRKAAKLRLGGEVLAEVW